MDILMKNLIEGFSASSREDNIIDVIKNSLNDMNINSSNFKISEDSFGNLVVKVGSGDEKIMLCTHVDNYGIITVESEDKGFIKVMPVGNISSEKLVGKFIKFENGSKGFIIESDKELFVDLSICTEQNSVKNGEVGQIIGKSFQNDERLVGTNIHNKVCIYVFLKVIEEVKEEFLDKEFYFVFTKDSKLEFNGARIASNDIRPNMAIVLDSIEATDYPNGKEDISIDKGTVLSIFDRSLVIHNDVKKLIQDAAKDLKLQYSINDDKNEGGVIHKEVGGIKTGMISIPCRNKDSLGEIIAVKDVKNTIEILKKLVNK